MSRTIIIAGLLLAALFAAALVSPPSPTVRTSSVTTLAETRTIDVNVTQTSITTQTVSQTLVTTRTVSLTAIISPTIGNETFQFIGASVTDFGVGGIAVNATFRNNTPWPQFVSLVGTTYPAEVRYEPVYGGKPLGPLCCPIVRSYSTNASVSSVNVNVTPGGRVSSNIVFPSLNGSEYWVKVLATSLDRTTVLSPASYLLLETSTSQGNNSGKACGGQEDVGPLFYDPDNGQIYVANSGTDAVTVIDGHTGKLVATISLPLVDGFLEFKLYNPTSRQLYVGSQDTNEAFTIDTSANQLVGKTTVSPQGQPRWRLHNPNNGLNYTISGNSLVATGLNSSTGKFVNQTIPLPPPQGLSSSSRFSYLSLFFNPSNKEIYVYGMDTFDGFDTSNPDRLVAVATGNNSVVASIPVRGLGGGLVQVLPSFFYDSSTGNVYATTDLNPTNGTMGLLEISGKTNIVISQVTLVGLSFGTDMAFDTSSDLLFGAKYPASVSMMNILTGAPITNTVLGSCSFFTLPP
jgi:YVTN family beta-propeller protein